MLLFLSPKESPQVQGAQLGPTRSTDGCCTSTHLSSPVVRAGDCTVPSRADASWWPESTLPSRTLNNNLCKGVCILQRVRDVLWYAQSTGSMSGSWSGRSCVTLGTPCTSSRPSEGTSQLLSLLLSQPPRCPLIPNRTLRYPESTVTLSPCCRHAQAGATGAQPRDMVQPLAWHQNAPVPIPPNLGLAPFQTEAP